MRGAMRVVAFVVGVSALGCAQDKYHLNPKHPEQVFLPPNEKRYNEPETAPYRKPVEQSTQDEKALLNRPVGGPGGLGGF